MGSDIASSYRALVSRIELRKWLQAQPGMQVAIHIRGDDVGGAYSMIEAVAAPGFRMETHYHSFEDEVFFIVEGTVRFQCGERSFAAPSGTSVVVPRGVAHAWQNLGLTPARMTAMFTPGGIENLYEQVVGRSPLEREALARRYGTVVVHAPGPVNLCP